MLVILLVAFPGIATLAFNAREATAVTPIQKVLQLMEDMLDKGRAEKDAEATRYSAFSQWCSDQTRMKKNEISQANSDIEQLNANIEQAAATIRQLAARIDELDEDVGRWTKDQKSISDVRNKEAVDFKATSIDYTESIDAIIEAVMLLKKQAYSRPQAEQALLQVQRQRLVPVGAKAALTALLQQDEPNEMLFREAPEAYGYEFQSGGVVEMLEKLMDEFSTKKRELEAEELNAQHAFEQIMQQLADNIESAKHEGARKSAMRSKTKELKAEAEGDLTQTTKDRDEDHKYLDEMTALCEVKSNDFASRQQMRKEEIIALEKAIDIISSKTVAGAGEKHLPSLLQKPCATVALAQVRNGQQNPAQERASAFLAERARESGSRLLSEASQRLVSDPFSKVKKMIKDLIIKLMEEATSETEHKGWCDAELVANKIAREGRAQDVSQLKTEIEDLMADVAQLTQDLSSLAIAIKELEDAMAAATEERTTSKAANEQTIKDATEAQTAVQEAIAVMKDYYAKSAQATALVQQTPMEDAPETFEKPYQGMLPDGGNVVDFLEVILTDFARLESETSAAEAQANDEYKKILFESKKDKALKEGEVSHKSNRKTDKESALHSAAAELESTQEQLDKANAYYEKLKPTCVESGISYEDRVKKREEEIQSLQEALQILTGQDLPTLA